MRSADCRCWNLFFFLLKLYQYNIILHGQVFRYRDYNSIYINIAIRAKGSSNSPRALQKSCKSVKIIKLWSLQDSFAKQRRKSEIIQQVFFSIFKWQNGFKNIAKQYNTKNKSIYVYTSVSVRHQFQGPGFKFTVAIQSNNKKGLSWWKTKTQCLRETFKETILDIVQNNKASQ